MLLLLFDSVCPKFFLFSLSKNHRIGNSTCSSHTEMTEWVSEKEKKKLYLMSEILGALSTHILLPPTFNFIFYCVSPRSETVVLSCWCKLENFEFLCVFSTRFWVWGEDRRWWTTTKQNNILYSRKLWNLKRTKAFSDEGENVEQHSALICKHSTRILHFNAQRWVPLRLCHKHEQTLKVNSNKVATRTRLRWSYAAHDDAL